jgi:hypothetical protein
MDVRHQLEWGKHGYVLSLLASSHGQEEGSIEIVPRRSEFFLSAQ